MKREIRSYIVSAIFVAFLATLLLGGRAAEAGGSSLASDQDVQSLGSSDNSEQHAAAEKLMKGSKDSIPVLLNGLGSSSQQVKTKALWILRQIRMQVKSLNDDSIATELGKKGRTENDPKLRRDMMLALGELRGAKASGELKRFASEDSDDEVRRIATRRVAQVSPSKETQFFKKQASDVNVQVRLAAFIELAQMGDMSGRDLALKTVSGSVQIDERAAAFELLGYAGNPDDAALLKSASESATENYHSRYFALRAYRHNLLLQLSSKDRLNFLIKSLDDPSEGVRDCAFLDLYHSPDPNTNARLKKYLGEKGHIGYSEAAHTLGSS